MAKLKRESYSPLIYEYLKKYQNDPTSRVFAPLAEAYRKAGLLNEAVEISREGLRIHPTFIGGRVALARALFDLGKFSEVIDELSLVIQDAPDNLVAQRLIAESSLILGRVAESLSAYKMLLYFNPHDAETAKMVSELEAQAYEKGTLVLRTDPPKEAEKSGFEVTGTHDALERDPDRKRLKWVRRVEILQNLLLKVDRYRTRVALRSGA